PIPPRHRRRAPASPLQDVDLTGSRGIRLSPKLLSTSSLPPCCVTISQLIDRPSPVPSPVGLVVKKGWNSFSRASGPMPVPLSRTLTSISVPGSRVITLRLGLYS